MKLNLKKQFLNVDGKPLCSEQDLPMNEFLANVLAQSKAPANNAVKFFDWALTLHKHGEIEIDPADKETLLKFVQGAGLNTLATAQLVKEIEAIK